MTEIFNGRYTARAGKPLVLFLIGLRLNKLWAVHKWLPVFIAMPRMLAELDRKPEPACSRIGCIIPDGFSWCSNIGSFRQAHRLRHDPSAKHYPAWRRLTAP